MMGTNGIAPETNGITLRECPFCGGEAVLQKWGLKPYVACTKCGCSMPDRHQEDEQAIEAWNTRATRKPTDAVREFAERYERRIRQLEGTVDYWRGEFENVKAGDDWQKCEYSGQDCDGYHFCASARRIAELEAENRRTHADLYASIREKEAMEGLIRDMWTVIEHPYVCLNPESLKARAEALGIEVD